MIRDDLFPNDVRQAPPSTLDEAEQRIAAAPSMRRLAGARFKDVAQFRTAMANCGYNGGINPLLGEGRHVTYKAKYMGKDGTEYAMLLNQSGEHMLEVANVQTIAAAKPPPEEPQRDASMLAGLPHSLVGREFRDMLSLGQAMSDLELNTQDKVIMRGTSTTHAIKAVGRTGWEYKILVNDDPLGVRVLNVDIIHANPGSDPAMVKELQRLIKEG